MFINILRINFGIINLMIASHLYDVIKLCNLSISYINIIIPVYVLLINFAIESLRAKQCLSLLGETLTCLICFLLYYHVNIALILPLTVSLCLGSLSLLVINRYWIKFFTQLSGNFYFKKNSYIIYNMVFIVIGTNTYMLYKIQPNHHSLFETLINSLILNIGITWILHYPFQFISMLLSDKTTNYASNIEQNPLESIAKNSIKSKVTQ